MLLRVALTYFLTIVSNPALGSDGQFAGELVAKLASDGRNMVLTQPFSYVDPNGRRWDVPAGSETDGASIPKAFWIAYPPFTGRYRTAAVIHDYYCQTQERSWQETHQVFYDAMITAGVDKPTAKVMWGAVYYMGPRWVLGRRGLASRSPGPSDLNEQQQTIERLEAWISLKDPSQSDIAAALDSGVIP